ncbi:uncharacterized protein LOC115589319 [Sparus aurata]|uniref:uncharacterized protein LOC115589319 n=1 Tax=Sparus aurata TaxID=8175 RepID=UPI0011C0EEA1|nr:uncharacterized protein LOC115589319 [Sparus aurata]
MTPKLTDRPKNNTVIIAGLAGGILSLLAVCVIATIIYCYCQITKQKTDQDTTPEPSDPAPEEQLLTSEGEPVPSGSHAPPTPDRTGTEERKRGIRTTSKPETLRLKNMGNTRDILLAAETQLIGSHQPIVALVGDDVLLPCHLEPPLDVTTLSVEWRRGSALVHVYRSRGDDPVSQDQNFKGFLSTFIVIIAVIAVIVLVVTGTCLKNKKIG